ncbi:antibiotic biosynthesis monooxygenase [Rhizobiaceae bacterium n13]|uniref:Antibiotic biosynthesis monooxygenase n=1 Tax=Ferirhizobium litorale TaxID=2927786 RepID=A0AAE3QHV9_9HYPH|nr:antibiotic biosynthesis monooxygenase [Fererhizobium litorale]MDI7864184.1 antibiotic biosynthesis monooxygenase [Fererhizobium litorale]MDI7923795.1 antibiotic biosynthesis monooxygenase [Fererhizobium litorale]
MIYEIAVLPVHKEQIETFRQAFGEVLPLLSRAKGYCGHVLAQGIETPEVFNLMVRWRLLEDHTLGFEASEDHAVFMRGIQEYFSDEPTVYHLEGGAFAASEQDNLDAVASIGNAATPGNLRI